MIGERVCIESSEGILCGTIAVEPANGFMWLQDVINFTRLEFSPWAFAVPYIPCNFRVLVS